MRRVVTYIRISKGKQGQRDLEINAQRATLSRFVEAEGCEALAEFIEVETGKGADALDRRPQLAAAIAAARKRKAAVLVETLGRLSRDVHFIAGLMALRVQIIVAALDRRGEPSSAAPVSWRSFGRSTRLARPAIKPSRLH